MLANVYFAQFGGIYFTPDDLRHPAGHLYKIIAVCMYSNCCGSQVASAVGLLV